jgi:type IV pilus biogenesis protein PilP
MTRKDAFFRFVSAASVIAFIGMAQAQDVPAPDESQLATPGAAATAPQAQTAATGAMPEQPQAVENDNAGTQGNDPCPTPASISKAPDDLAKVQEDIDRFTLCVQRAQLLERLNESLLKNQQSSDMALGLGGMPGVAGAQRAGSPGLMPLPANALAGADVAPRAPGAGMAPAKAPSAPAVQAPAEKQAEAKAEPEMPAMPWTIREIYGAGTGVEAKLVSPEGDEVKAKSGMKLPDGKTTVVRVTPAGVTVKDDKGVKPLDWVKS